MRIGDSNVQALAAIGTAQQVSADNVANVNTEGFDSSRAVLETGPGGEGVRVADVQEISAPGPMMPAPAPSPSSAEIPPLVEGSNTDIPREMTNMIMNENAYDANAVAIRTQDDMQGTVIDMIA